MKQSWKCRFGWHNWSKWVVVGHGTERFAWQSKDQGNSVILQSRFCKCCGLTVTKTVTGF